MGVPLVQQYRVGRYILSQKLKRVKRYPLVLMLEPLFRCNLACSGCGKIDYPSDILNKRLSYEKCMEAIDECGAPMVSIAGGEPLIHKEMRQIVQGYLDRKKFVYLCTNAILLDKHMDSYEPSKYLTFSIHLDGGRERHDASVCRKGVYDKCVSVIKKALQRGFRVTVNCTLFQGETPDEVSDFMDEMMALGVEGVTISPGYSYERAPKQDVFLKKSASKNLFRDIFKAGKGKKWRFNQSTLYLDFLAGNQTYHCTPWGNPTRNVFGWQKPCYLLVGEGYASTFDELINDTAWDKYGTGVNPKCADCMVHCGYEATAVDDTFNNPLKALKVFLAGPKTQGDLAPEVPFYYEEEPEAESQTIIPMGNIIEKAGTEKREVA
ncbi:MAG: adenosyl-hopene transferase HpnH [Proteobacteria bacterium]|jgi:hopanoid biosynthesis associated radical SAM protein HpnH|nr:adenosyl-hopene transferase HpnH [Pseudomonadota bacterium]MBT5065248.1 adenosyl-hopene transferase HpnH [Pseudomonadota bacterium]MBT6193640.1 adenosyl-hopene transferase HpnH [Pseudomonadota bacterium]MBT6464371.1 adenosyl-hopene transferase HpnH [Pseudomonadota bacterium]MBT6673953.1 adenosyl-hopene transferase HpnH [Pseudomonadota bacterium]